MRRLTALVPVAGLLLLIALFAGWSLHRKPQVVPNAMVGKPLPDLQLIQLSDGAVGSLRSAVKGPALVNFYASWCAPCAEEAPALRALRAEGVRIVGVAYKDTPAHTEAFLSRLGNPFETVFLDQSGLASVELGLTGVPETYAVDAAGVIRGKAALPLTAEDAETLLQTAEH